VPEGAAGWHRRRRSSTIRAAVHRAISGVWLLDSIGWPIEVAQSPASE